MYHANNGYSHCMPLYIVLLFVVCEIFNFHNGLFKMQDISVYVASDSLTDKRDIELLKWGDFQIYCLFPDFLKPKVLGK